MCIAGSNKVKILSLNIRATQGGAGRMGYDLHKRLQAMGHDVRLLYGYGSGIAEDPEVRDDASICMLGMRPAVLANYAAHLLVGHDVFTPRRAMLRDALAWADVIHVHAAHHWYLCWSTLIDMIVAAAKPVIMTAHDWWLVSGRCGFTRDCTGWQRACGECGKRRFEDLPSIFDRSRAVRFARQRDLRRMARQLTIVCPSQHLQRDHVQVFPDLDIRFIPNALDREYEEMIERPAQIERRGILFCASDLTSPGKIDAGMVRALAATHGEAVELVGRGNPFPQSGATNHGEVRDRRQLAKIFGTARLLVFTSRMDNAPLTIIEALVAGCHVVAYPSAAAAEMLALVGGRCVTSPEEARELIDSGRERELYGNVSTHQLAAKAREVWSGRRLVEAYLAIYEEQLGRQSKWAT
ncbi:glycosyltransferase [Bradyrhizobium sp. 150]|uniref:glycosyltransferase n=1 Tax=Bradyrhizobium sp. 150 TaxID=2782625 RepID=UPI001FF80EEB|nr:glycosyltransferase [Bradyrhizobium sp. 150]MCK1675312.1 glycosyltransferase [Bradyrhizobium sp. 150]